MSIFSRITIFFSQYFEKYPSIKQILVASPSVYVEVLPVSSKATVPAVQLLYLFSIVKLPRINYVKRYNNVKVMI